MNAHEREKRSVHKFQKRAGWNDIHHLKNRTKGGESIQSNVLALDAYRHDAVHLLFKDLSLKEIISVLKRLDRLKDYQASKSRIIH